MIGRRSHDDAQSFEEAWNGRTPKDEHIAELVRFAEDLCEAAAVEPSSAFRDSLRAQLMTEAATVLVTSPPATERTSPAAPRETPSIRRRLASLTAVLVASTGIVTAVASSASAVPGEILYPVKRGVESVELALHRDDASRGSFQLARATERLAEARTLSSRGASDGLIVETLESFSSEANDGSSRLFSDFTDSGKEQSIRKVNDFAATASAGLSALSSRIPPSADDSFADATDAISDLATQATSLCSACTTADVESLVSAVTGLTKSEPVRRADREDGDNTSSPTSGDRTPSNDSGTTGSSTPTPAPAAPAPTSAPTKTPSLRDVTDPLLGPLLGDDDQEGAVPGLLNGLLGTGKK